MCGLELKIWQMQLWQRAGDFHHFPKVPGVWKVFTRVLHLFQVTTSLIAHCRNTEVSWNVIVGDSFSFSSPSADVSSALTWDGNEFTILWRCFMLQSHHFEWKPSAFINRKLFADLKAETFKEIFFTFTWKSCHVLTQDLLCHFYVIFLCFILFPLLRYIFMVVD